jgi:predicted DNA-binding transcriptional regulator AlpA
MQAANDNVRSPLPFGVAPRGFNREQAAAYVGVSPSKFDGLVVDGAMPQPKMVGSRTVWDRYLIDQAFEELPDRQPSKDFDDAGDCFGEVSASRRHRRNRA